MGKFYCTQKKYWAPIQTIPQSAINNSLVIPIVNRYLYRMEERTNISDGLTIPASKFTNDAGLLTDQFRIFYPNGYVDLIINGVLQLGRVYTAQPNALILHPNNSTILKGAPIIVQSIGFV